MTAWPHFRREAPALVALAIPFAASAACGRPLPEAAREAAWAGLGLYAVLVVLPLVDPLRRIRWDRKPLPGLRLAAAVAASATALLMARALFDGEPEAARRIGALAVVAFLAVVGNALPALPPNLFIGIRVPWTLRDRRVWAQTHRVAGHGLVALTLGLVALWPVFDGAAYEAVSITALALGAVAILIYSWTLSRSPSV